MDKECRDCSQHLSCDKPLFACSRSHYNLLLRDSSEYSLFQGFKQHEAVIHCCILCIYVAIHVTQTVIRQKLEFMPEMNHVSLSSFWFIGL